MNLMDDVTLNLVLLNNYLLVCCTSNVPVPSFSIGMNFCTKCILIEFDAGPYAGSKLASIQ